MCMKQILSSLLCLSLSASSFKSSGRGTYSTCRLAQNLHMAATIPSSSTALPLLRHLNDQRDIILASGSPRRKELLTLMGIHNFRVLKSDFAEDLDQSKYPLAASYCLDTAVAKAADVVPVMEGAGGYLPLGTLLIGADTIVEINGEILEKPKNTEDAHRMLSLMSGQVHTVHTAVVIFGNGPRQAGSVGGIAQLVKQTSFVESTSVKFVDLSLTDKEAYVESREGFDKAGGYGIQGLGGQMVEKIDGCYFNVMGLPLSRLSKALAALQSSNLI